MVRPGRDVVLRREAQALAELAALRMGVRADRPGVVRVDYQTAGAYRRPEDQARFGIVNAAGRLLGNPVVSQRYYLADGCFLVGLEGDDALLRRLDRALAAPVWQLFLGRKSYLPGEPVRLPDAGPDSDWWSMDMAQALRRYRWLGRGGERRSGEVREVRLMIDAEAAADTETRQDVPLDFASRRFGLRYVRTGSVRMGEVG